MQQRKQTIKAIQVEYKGIPCDSLLEAKFIILIEGEYSFLRHPVNIFYNKNTLMPISNISENPVYYKPDFLIRRWSDGKAFLVEVKNMGIEGAAEKVGRSETIARNYIKEKGYDWQFLLRLDKDIQAELTPEQLSRFMQEVRSGKDLYEYKRKFNKLDQQFRTGSASLNNKPRQMPCFIKGEPVSDIELKKYLWMGELPDRMRDN